MSLLQAECAIEAEALRAAGDRERSGRGPRSPGIAAPPAPDPSRRVPARPLRGWLGVRSHGRLPPPRCRGRARGPSRRSLRLAQQREEQVLGPDVVAARGACASLQRAARGRLVGAVERDERGRTCRRPVPARGRSAASSRTCRAVIPAARMARTARESGTARAVPSTRWSGMDLRRRRPTRAPSCAATTTLRAFAVKRANMFRSSLGTNRCWAACFVTPRHAPISVHEAAVVPSLVDEVPDQVVRHPLQVVGGQHRCGELFQRAAGVLGADTVDRGRRGEGRCHASTVD